MSTKTVKIHKVLPVSGEEVVFGFEPSWEPGYVVKDYKSELSSALSWHSRCATSKDAVEYVEEWIKIFRNTTAKEDIARWSRVKSQNVNVTLPALARIRIRGFPVEQKDLDRMWAYVESLIADAKSSGSIAVVEKPKVSVQDRIQAQLNPKFGEIDALIDQLAAGEVPDLKTFIEVLYEADFKAPHFKKLADYINEQLEEFVEVQQIRKDGVENDEQEQLLEGYEYMATRTLNRLVSSLEMVRDNLGKQVAKTKVTRIRRKKPVDKRKMVSRLRFKKTDDELGIEGEDPVQLLGASVAWVYDSKRRKLHYIVGEHAEALHVHGPKIRGLGKESRMKTLRKPDEQLRQFMTLRKNQMLPWFDKIKAKPGATTGRSTGDMILLKVF